MNINAVQRLIRKAREAGIISIKEGGLSFNGKEH